MVKPADPAAAVLEPAEQPERGCVCVTGATGYVAGHVVQQLLEKGYTVHATCRDPRNPKAVGHLQALPGAAQRLRLFQADLLSPGSFTAAMTGCSAVIHTASPYILDVTPGHEEAQLIRPALAGTENVLASVNACPTVTRVVLTSSTAAVFTDATERGPGHVFTEADWNVSASATHFPYFYSKMLAEQRAYEMAKEARGRWTLCSINPGAIWGPPLSSRVDGESVTQCLHLMSGVMWPYAARIGMGVVDVRDVARAHCAAVEAVHASGRYLINAASCYLLVDAARWLRAAHPKLWVPPLVGPFYGVLLFGPLMGLPRDLARAMLDKAPTIDASRAARDLGMTPESYIAPRDTVTQMADELLKRRMVPDFAAPVVPLASLCGLAVLAVVALAAALLAHVLPPLVAGRGLLH